MKPLLQRLCAVLSAMAITFHAAKADSVSLANGEKLTGRIRGLERDAVLLETIPVKGYPPATQRIGKSSIARLEFAPDQERDRLASHGGPAQMGELKAAWRELSPLLGVPDSPAARLGLRYAGLLAQAEGTEAKDEALGIFTSIFRQAKEATERAAAGRGRLRTLILSGRHPEAFKEAESLIKEGADPALCAEAHLVVAGSHAKRLRHHLEENPRWREDDRAGAERERLRNMALDSCLRAGLGCDSPPELAVRGLLGALQIHELCGDSDRALEIARDIAAIYPNTPGAQIAREFLARAQSPGSEASHVTSEPDARASSTHSHDVQNREPEKTP
jgi:hypothetical protein